MRVKRSMMWYTAPPIFLFWAVMLGWFIVRETASAQPLLTQQAILGYQPSQEVTWFVVTQNNVPVGYTMRHIGEVPTEEATQYIVTERRGLATTAGTTFVTVEGTIRATVDEQFRLLSFTSSFMLNDSTFEASGAIVGDTLQLTVTTNGETTTQQIPADQASRLPLTFEPFLASHQLHAGETFSVTTLDPLTLQSHNGTLEVLGPDTIILNGVEEPVVRVRATLGGVSSVLFLNSAGERVREEADGGFVEERTDREEALHIRDALKLTQ